MATVGEIRRLWRERASAREVDPRDADILLGDLLEKPLSWIVAHADSAVGVETADALEALLQRRLRREPLQYIRGRAEFFGREFHLDERVLIPRPETEHLVEEAIGRIRNGANVLDIGTGSGCVAISIALERTDLALYASDVSPSALALAAMNARRLGARVRFFASDVYEALGTRARFAAIVSNPPYIPAREIPTLQAEVRDYEPQNALTPGESGLEVIERLVERAGNLLEPDGIVLFEIGYSQSDAVSKIASAAGWSCAFKDDLQGIPRVAILSR
ncbi:MAG TPA: peptide chain release factor N(5)-glutamine methyltransferase [Thermoanaerobaculia bacterium]|nr:peptide chain release factor N(5)-glutamine methyltransferase [Thermoanaerobaculia bacterium]